MELDLLLFSANTNNFTLLYTQLKREGKSFIFAICHLPFAINVMLNLSIICQVVTYGRLKTKENFKPLALKVVLVTYERWSLARGSKYSDLAWKLLVVWRTGR